MIKRPTTRDPLRGCEHDTKDSVPSKGEIDYGLPISATVVVRRPIPESAADALELYLAENDVTMVNAWTWRGEGRLRVIGSPAAFESAFSTRYELRQLVQPWQEGDVFLAAVERPSLPDPLRDHVRSLVGLSSHRIARPYFVVLDPSAPEPANFRSPPPAGTFLFSRAAGYRDFVQDLAEKGAEALTPLEVAKLYDFPTGADGAGQAIALIELGGGYQIAQQRAYFRKLGIATPPTIKAYSVDGAKNDPGDGSGANGEVQLDVQVAGAVAPGAEIRVYFAPNSSQGFYDAVAQAIHDDADVVSISWGGIESTYGASQLDNFDALFRDAAAKGITVLVASGDSGSSGGGRGTNCDFPASSPWVTACGGTLLRVNDSGLWQTVWNDADSGGGASGGGVSRHFPVPNYQASYALPPSATTKGTGRGVPDVAGSADPHAGYKVTVDGVDQTIGGTSAVAPLMAGLVARTNQLLGRRVGFLNPVLYGSHPDAAFFDVPVGNNGAYSANPGAWDACTGLGSINGNDFVALFGGAGAGSGANVGVAKPRGGGALARFQAF